MPNQPPEKIAIDHDDYHAQHIGRTPDGRQFFLTTPFEPAMAGQEGCEYVALFLFDSDGALVDSKIDSLGPRARMDRDAAKALYDERLRDMGNVEFTRIEVQPFVVEQFNRVFGLIARPPESDDDAWAVELQPGNYMAFFEPWDSGIYDT